MVIFVALLFGTLLLLGVYASFFPAQARYWFVRAILRYADFVNTPYREGLDQFDCETQVYENERVAYPMQYKKVIAAMRRLGIITVIVSSFALWYLLF